MHILYAYNLLRTYHTRHHSKFLTCSNSFVFTSLQRYPFSANTSVLPFLFPALICFCFQCTSLFATHIIIFLIGLLCISFPAPH